MNKTLSVKINQQLLKKLETVARARGVSKSSVVKRGLELVLLKEEGWPQGLIKQVSEALRENRRVPVRVNWQRIGKELARTSPKWKTLAEAMSASRGREWAE